MSEDNIQYSPEMPNRKETVTKRIFLIFIKINMGIIFSN